MRWLRGGIRIFHLSSLLILGCTQLNTENHSGSSIGPDVVISYTNNQIQWCTTNSTSANMYLFIYPNPGFTSLFWTYFEKDTIIISTLYGEWRGIEKDRGSADKIPYGVRELMKSSKVCDTIALDEYPIGILSPEVPFRGKIYLLDPWTLNIPIERNLYGSSIVFEIGWLSSNNITEFEAYSTAISIKTIDHKKYRPLLKRSNTIIAK